MKKLLVILLLAVPIFAQGNITIKDTIDVVTLQKFNVPKDRYIVLTNIKRAAFSAELLDENFNKLRDSEDFWQDPAPSKIKSKARGGRGVMVQYAAKEAIEKPGKYYIKIHIKFRDEKGSGSASAYYMINVDYPRMGSEVKLREHYFFSEKETMSFSTLEFKDPNGYSYKIIDGSGNELLSGNGAIVKLNDVFSNISNVGKTITVKGFYHKKEFEYIYDGQGVHKSEWTFTLDKPNLEEFDDWKKNKPDDQISISAWNKNAMRLLYTYIGSTPNGFVVVYPNPKRFKITSEPADFIQGARYHRTGNFLYVSFSLNQDYLNSMEDCAEQPVKIKVQFTTQFGESVVKDYDGTILK